MTQEQLIEKIRRTKIVPVVVLNSVEETLPKMQALINGGLPCAEITFRTPCAAEACFGSKDLSRYAYRRGHGYQPRAMRKGD